ncbi:MAG: hypothetical protein A3B68_02865 [Candidatus Melainabacteria bacterium RIFCSPHIGHO2_02_FULL_34_12]|nr:MAG: hypothetical protein A3B68_02865 [Candidatus Melainabacteria bacterium RIFCSPHIGHO2_02_FULL_34_12]
MSIYKKIIVLISTTILSFIFISQTFHVIASSPKQSRGVLEYASTTHNDTCTVYKWFDPNTSSKEGELLLKNCSSCHIAYYKEWKDDKHSMSQNNPFFLEVYKRFKEDHPDKNGNCALCHNPEATLSGRDAPAGRLNDIDLRKRNAKKTNGISCDFCHKIESVDQNPFKKGVEGLNILRTCKGMKDIRFGPIKDSIKIERIDDETEQKYGENEELKYNSLYKTSLICAKCHDGSNGNVQIYSTFTEWANSPAAKKGVQCQSCHMKPGRDALTERFSIVDNPNIKQKSRPYHQIHSHSFLSSNPHEFRKKYVDLMITVKTPHRGVSTNGNNILIVTAKVSNNNFGHSFPTGSPMRNAILVIDVKYKNRRDGVTPSLQPVQIKGPKLPIYAGNLKNKPGKLFAKILSETYSEYGTRFVGAHRGAPGIRDIPPPDWWNVFIASDTRIMAGKSDITTYEFEIPDHARVEVTSTLRWRNTWPGLAKIKGIKLEEDILFFVR